MDIAVSIVIPIYNMERYLPECLDSVCGQTLRNLEIICIDDGSTDRSPEIIHAYAEKDDRIVVIHKSNSGYGDSVNQGIARATGQFIAIAEPDDCVPIDAYETLYTVAASQRLDVVKGNYMDYYSASGVTNFREHKLSAETAYYGCLLSPLTHPRIFRAAIANWTGIYRKTFIQENNILHNTTPGASYQDAGFWFQVMTCVRRLMYIDHDCYFYRNDNPGSSMNDRGKVFHIFEESAFLRKRYLAVGKLEQYIRQRLTECLFLWFHDTLDRIYPEDYAQFILRAVKEFQTLRLEGLFDDSEMVQSEREILHKATNETDAWITYRLRQTNLLHDALQTVPRVLIYGAGVYGRHTLYHMYRMDCEKVLGFAVTEMGRQPTYMDGKPVREISAWMEEYPEAHVILGVSAQYREAVLRELKKYKNAQVIEIGE